MQSAVEVELELVVECVQLDNQAPSAELPVVSNNTSSCACGTQQYICLHLSVFKTTK